MPKMVDASCAEHGPDPGNSERIGVGHGALLTGHLMVAFAISRFATTLQNRSSPGQLGGTNGNEAGPWPGSGAKASRSSECRPIFRGNRAAVTGRLRLVSSAVLALLRRPASLPCRRPLKPQQDQFRLPDRSSNDSGAAVRGRST